MLSFHIFIKVLRLRPVTIRNKKMCQFVQIYFFLNAHRMCTYVIQVNPIQFHTQLTLQNEKIMFQHFSGLINKYNSKTVYLETKFQIYFFVSN